MPMGHPRRLDKWRCRRTRKGVFRRREQKSMEQAEDHGGGYGRSVPREYNWWGRLDHRSLTKLHTLRILVITVSLKIAGHWKCQMLQWSGSSFHEKHLWSDVKCCLIVKSLVPEARLCKFEPQQLYLPVILPLYEWLNLFRPQFHHLLKWG